MWAMLSTLFLFIGLAQASDWSQTLAEAVPSVVMIRSYSPVSFEGKGSGVSSATGFVVDAERGIILTNRHVVRTGPIVADAVFQNNEEIDLVPLYRDPVHDFGFFQYDPKSLEHTEPRTLPLRPDLAVQGMDVRRVGSDAGEKVSILSGTLAWLDRDAPNYGVGNYNDFNTFYIQAASGSSGGSSGSPVLDIKGNVVALNAGSKRRAASSFFLPLPRVLRALELIQSGQDVSRGTLHTTFLHETFDEARRFGLPSEVEADLRDAKPTAKGVLVVDRVLTEGATSGVLDAGDILYRVAGQRITDFVSLEILLDAAVGETIELETIRGGVIQEHEVTVADLHAVSPASFIEVGGTVFHDLAYQTARHTALPVSGVQVAHRGYMLGNEVPHRSVVTHINGQSVANIEALEELVVGIPDRSSFNLQVVTTSEPERPLIYTVEMDRRWFPARRCARVDGQRDWDCRDLAPGPDEETRTTRTAKPLATKGRVATRLGPGIVLVNYSIPFRTDGVYAASFSGVGVVVDKEKGLVLVDRDTVTVGLGDASVVFAGSVEVPARVVAIHPTANLALIRYTPEDIGDTSVTEIRFSEVDFEAGDTLKHVGLSARLGLAEAKVKVKSYRGISMPVPRVPFFRQANLPVVETDTAGEGFVGGVLTKRCGSPVAFVASFPNLVDDEVGNYWRGIGGKEINRFIADPSGSASFGVEWSAVTLMDARERGLPEKWAEKLEAHDPRRREVLRVTRVTRESAADGEVQPGDLLLAVDGKLVNKVADLPRPIRGSAMAMTLLRGRDEITVSVRPDWEDADPFRRFLLWGGLLVQEPHDALARQRYQPTDGVYISYYWTGSPAGRFGLRPMRRVVSVNGEPTPDLTTFAEQVRGLGLGEAVRLTTVDLKGRRRMVTMEADPAWWPLEELAHDGNKWSRAKVPTGPGE